MDAYQRKKRKKQRRLAKNRRRIKYDRCIRPAADPEKNGSITKHKALLLCRTPKKSQKGGTRRRTNDEKQGRTLGLMKRADCLRQQQDEESTLS